MSKTSAVILRPVAGMPRNSPRCVPTAVSRAGDPGIFCDEIFNGEGLVRETDMYLTAKHLQRALPVDQPAGQVVGDEVSSEDLVQRLV